MNCNNNSGDSSNFDVHKMRKNLTLDFEQGRGRARVTFGTGFTPMSGSTPSAWPAACLNSADVDRLKFDTPEIEKFLIQSSNQVPTPSNHDVNNNSHNGNDASNVHLMTNGHDRNGNNADEGYYDEDIKPLILATEQQQYHHQHHSEPMHYLDATEEQKEYVKGFEEALQSVRSRSESSASSTNVPVHHHQQPQHHHQPIHVPTSSPMYTHQMMSDDQEVESPRHHLHVYPSSGSSSVQDDGLNNNISSPINMEQQEKAKLERKRLRNRIAASKCRKRKLEKISKLEEKVRQIKGENSELVNSIKALRDHVMTLKQEIMEHEKHGCRIMSISVS